MQNTPFRRCLSQRSYPELTLFKSFDDSWENWKFKINNYHDAGGVIIVTGEYEGKNRKTGKSFISEAAHVYELKSGKIVSFQQYADSKVIWDAME